MKVFRLRHKQYKGDVVFGLPSTYNNSPGEKQINELFSKMKPWTHAIPYYKNSKFAFVSPNAILTFLNQNSKLTEEELADINDKFYIEIFEVEVWSAGLSKFLCTYFDDEVIDNTNDTIDIDTIKNWTYKFVYQDPVPKEDINMVKTSYYSNVKTYY